MAVNVRDGLVMAMLGWGERGRLVFRSEVKVYRDKTRKREGRGSIGYVENRQRSDLNEGMAAVLKSQLFEIKSRIRTFTSTRNLALRHRRSLA